MKKLIVLSVLGLAATAAMAQPAGTKYFAADWNTNDVVYMDQSMTVLGQFPSGGQLPNGMASDGQRIYAGFFFPPSVNVFDLDGNLITSWTHNNSGLQGMEIVEGEIAIAGNGFIEFYDAGNGTFIRAIPNGGGSVEGLAYSPDSGYLYQLGADAPYSDADILVTDPADGTVVTTIPNPAQGSDFGGTGLAYARDNQLMVVGSQGEWYLIDAHDGAVLDKGNNGIAMFGLGSMPEETAGCYPDCDGDSVLTIDDFICFQTLFALGDPYADCDGDTALTIDDFICFQTLFAIGC